MDELDLKLREYYQGEDDQDGKDGSSKKGEVSVSHDVKLMILGSLVPNLVMENLGEKIYTFQAVLLMADVSGFTELCDKYSKNSIRASSQITEIINIYMGEMVKVVYEFNGDVVNFSGDAILAIWKMEDSQDLASAMMAADCAVYIQERIGEYVTQVNTLRVKLIITTGIVHYLMVGGKNKKDFIILGEGILSLKKTEKFSSGGQTIVTSTLVNNITKKRFKFEPLVQNEIWRLLGHRNVTDFGNRNSFHQESGVNYLLSLRPLLRHLTTEDGRIIKLFMMSAVNNAIETIGKVEQMTEMRNVVIVFINIITVPETQISYLAQTIELCYLKIYNVVLKMDGAVNKFSLFDKDLMFLVIFGLRYYKGSVTEKTALKCAREVKEELEKEDTVISVSIGVTSGTVYCGVVGHPVRREFTVIGLKVNMAARLMVAYQKMIVCDRETFLHSRIDYKNFTLQEPKYLKGISNVGPIYMYLGQEKEDDLILRTISNYPLLGRDKEIASFENVVKKAFSQRTTETKSVIAFMGESGQGKTRILEEIRIICQERFLCLLVDLQQSCLDIPYSGFQEICRGPLGLTENSSIYERESRLYNLLKGEDYQKNFICLLNKVFNVNFVYTSAYYTSDSRTREIQLRKLIVLIMKRLTLKPTVIIIDNAEYMDKISWLLLNDIIKVSRVVTILGIGTKAELQNFSKNFLKKKSVKIMTVDKIDQDYLIGLACQMLSVEAIPYELLVKIQKDSEGNPGWIEGFILVCIQTGYLYFKDDRPDLLDMERLVKAPKHMLERGHDISVSKLVGRAAGIPFQQTEYEMVKACVIGEDFKNEGFPLNHETRVISSFYRLQPYIRQILKYCAALGDTFSRELLVCLLNNEERNRLNEAIQILFEKKILGCATKTHSYDQGNKYLLRKRLLNLSSDNKIDCICPLEINASTLIRPKYAYCQFFRFVSRDLQNAVNAILTHAEKKDYHTRIIFYLHDIDMICNACKRHEGRWKHNGVDNVIYYNFTQKDLDTPGIVLLGGMENMLSTDKDRINYLIRNSSLTCTIRFSYVNLSDCQCHLIRIKVNEHFSYHCTEGEIFEGAINSMLDNVTLYLTLTDVLQATYLLDKVSALLKRVSNLIKEPYVWKISCATGLVNLLTGICKTIMGHVSESLKFYHIALINFGCNYPTKSSKIWFKTKIEVFRMKFLITHGQSRIGKTKCKEPREYVKDHCIIETLNFLTKSYHLLCDWENAKLAGVWSLNKAFKLGSNFLSLTYALGNVIYLSPKLHYDYFFSCLQEFAERLACLSAGEASYLELRGILHLYKGLFYVSVSRGQLEEALEYGHVTLSISLPVQEFENKLRLIPRMIIIYLLQLDVNAAISKLAEYESIMNSDVDNSSRIWYLAIIMMINLYYGIELMTYSEAKNFLDKSGKLMVVKDLEAEMLLTCCTWLYAIRKKMWDEARTWIPSILKDSTLKFQHPTFVLLLVFEGLLLQFSRIESVNMNFNLGQKIFDFNKIITDVIDEDLVWKPRLLHLLAYRHRIDNDRQLSTRCLIKASHLAESQGNNFELLSIRSDNEKWTSDLSTGHNIKEIKPIEWKGRVYKRIVLYNLPLDDHYY